MKTLYLDCVSGISGDMTLAALVSAGADFDMLCQELNKLPIADEFHLHKKQTEKSGIGGISVEVHTDSHVNTHSRSADHHHGHHEHSHSHDGEHHHQHSHSHDDEHHHEHTHPHEHSGHHHSHENSHGGGHSHHHRNLHDCLAIIDAAEYSERVQGNAHAIFGLLAEAEASVHNTTIEEIHFHEVGAVDAIVDIVGVCICLELLDIEKIICSPMPTFHGFVDCAHGRLPLPAPATAKLLLGVPWRKLDLEGELVTPTGAAIVKALADSFGPMPEFAYDAIGYGCGKMDLPIPNMLRAYIGELDEGDSETAKVSVLETNIDDMNPQLYEDILNSLMAARALDAYLTPIQMKKGRPAVKLTIVCNPEDAEILTDIVLRESTSLGIRMRSESRACLQRDMESVKTRYGKIRVKIARSKGEIFNIKPEHTDCQKAASEANVPVKLVYEAAIGAAYDAFRKE